MSVLPQRATLRWKEWVPLYTQQQRLRNLIQIIAYNVKLENREDKGSFYYTLHMSTMSAPFYTSEKLESENPKWAELEISKTYGAATGVVIRLWLHTSSGDHVITVWGVYFSGLVYLGPRLGSSDPSTFHTNSIVFYMQGGYFTAPHCFKIAQQPISRVKSISLNASDIRPSYSVNLLSRLHTIQQAIKKQALAASTLRERISAGGLATGNEPKESAMLRRLLNRGRPKPQHQDVLRIKKEAEIVRFKVQMLTQEKNRKLSELRRISSVKDLITEGNQDRGFVLMDRYHSLQKEVEKLKECKKYTIDTKEALSQANSQLLFRRRQLINELKLIYPISQVSGAKYTICGVHLPNSEDFAGVDECMISVALGFVTHLLQMISFFLHVPLRYPLFHFGSRSRVVDHISNEISDKEREFPLFAKGKDKLQFNYGVYLLNKNIAQLRWYCGLTTSDLRATLPNLADLLHLKSNHNTFGFEIHHRTLSGSSLGSSPSPVNPPRFPSSRHRTQKTHLSYSLDKGLDKLDLGKPTNSAVMRKRSITHVGSEPILDAEGIIHSSEEENHKELSKISSWQSTEPNSMQSQICSESDNKNNLDLSVINANSSGKSSPNQTTNIEKCWNCDELSVLSAPEQLESLSRHSPVIYKDDNLKELSENCDKSIDTVIIMTEEQISEN
ncbi:UV-resistance associated gene [Lycorma delicatula]|uniref:UV-resistance associated gene n=1 Tax=Lycorma delicatula TaxID=130591 RepID=UPI003F50E7E2